MNTPKTHCTAALGRICTPRLLSCGLTFCLTCCAGFGLRAQNTQEPQDAKEAQEMRDEQEAQKIDSTHAKGYYHYFSLTLLTGVGFLLSGNNENTIQASFPYSVTDTAGVRTDKVFNSPAVKPYRYPKVFVGPLVVEIGGLRDYFTTSFSFQLIGNWTNGYNFTLGYGHNFYMNGFTKRSRNPAEKAFVIRPSIQIAYTEDGAFNDPPLLGSIDNSNKTISVFGKTSGPTYSITSNSRYGSSTQTYTSKTLDIAYAQNEWAMMPRISIASNPYLHRLRWELVLGYNIPFVEKGGIFVYQNDGNGNRHGIAGNFSLSQPTLTVNYNNQPIRSAPYRFSNYYLGLMISPTRWNHRKPLRQRAHGEPRSSPRRHYYPPAEKAG